jgi:mono/diheme cytochrome c family protein
MIKYIPLVIAVLLALALTGCQDMGDVVQAPPPPDNSNPPPPPPPPPPNPISYAAHIQLIFDAECIQCHVGSSPPGQLNLTTWADLMDNVGPHAPVVISGDPDNSYLAFKISQAAGSGRMPADGPPYLTDGQIDTIRQWIEEGAQNN